jgi:hypothetical protein
MLKIVKRNEKGWKSIGLRWHEQPWANRGFEFILHTPTPGQDNPKPRRFVVMFQWGPGAGYIGGRTAYFGFRCKDRRGFRSRKDWSKHNMYWRTPIQVGFTTNANQVPYPY